MDAVTELFGRIFHPGATSASAERLAGNRTAAIAAAVGWWGQALRAHGVDGGKVELFEESLRADLAGRLEETYRVYLEVNHQPKGLLRDAAIAVGLDLDAFPPATTMSVADAKVEVSRSAQAPYEPLFAAKV